MSKLSPHFEGMLGCNNNESEKFLIMKPLFFILPLLILQIAACDERGHDERSAFVHKFITSVYQYTDFYKKSLPHMPADAALELNTYRTMMTEEFEFVRYDKFFGSYEYYVRFTNGYSGVAYVSDKDGALVAQGFHIYSPEWGGGIQRHHNNRVPGIRGQY